MFNFAETSFTGAFATGFEADLAAGFVAGLAAGLTICRATGFDADLTVARAFVLAERPFAVAAGLLSTFVLTLVLDVGLDADVVPDLASALVACLIGPAALPFAATPLDAGFAAALVLGAGAGLAFLAFFAVTDFFDDAMTGHSCLVPGWSRDGGGSDTQLPFGAERRTSCDPWPQGAG
jgi:hypothetical protein